MTDNLQTIYDRLDSGNYAQALKITNKLLTSYPNEIILVALKSLTLLRLDRSQEAVQLANTIRKKQTIDEHILHLLTLVYTATRKCITPSIHHTKLFLFMYLSFYHSFTLPP